MLSNLMDYLDSAAESEQQFTDEFGNNLQSMLRASDRNSKFQISTIFDNDKVCHGWHISIHPSDSGNVQHQHKSWTLSWW